MNFLTLDFETYYDKDFSLSKLTTEEYIRDDRFEVIGVSVKIGDEPAVWFSGTKSQTKAWLDQFEMEKYFVVAHNMMFDGAILAWYFDIHPFALMDTLAMLRAVDGTEVGNSLAKAAERYGVGKKGTEVVAAMGKHRRDFTSADLQQYGEYCKNDVEITYQLFEILRSSFKNKELRLIDLTLRMFTKPALQLNLPLLEQHLIDVVDKKEALIAAANADKDSLMSNSKFADMLIDLGVEPPTKISPTTGKMAYALAKNDDGFKALADHWDERVQALVAARLGSKSTLEETRTQRFINIAKRGSLPVPLRYYAAHTGRWGGDDKLNLQNLPRGKKGAPPPKLKCAIVPPEGYVLIDSDSSQIEARVLAWLAGQNDLVDAFERGKDVYRIMAAKIYRRQYIENVTEEERFVGKTTILGCGYGMGHVKFRLQLRAFGVDLSEEWCKKVLRTYRDEYSHIPALWEEAHVCLDALSDEKLKTSVFGKQPQAVNVLPGIGFDMPSGLPLKYMDLRPDAIDERGRKQYIYSTRRGNVRIYGGKVVENICQALARCVIGEQMLKVAERYQVVLTVHDAVACIAREEEKEEAARYVQECMRWRPKWAQALPLDCEVKYGDSYGTTRKFIG
jgi:DNA polymerase